MLKIRSLEAGIKRFGGEGLYRRFMRFVSQSIFRAGVDADSLFWNYGYSPISSGLRLPPHLKPDATHAMLYHRLISEAVPSGKYPKIILDISAGRGGGAMLAASLFPGALVIASDIDKGAMAQLDRNTPAGNLTCMVCDGASIPIAERAVDLIIAVETIHHFDFIKFLADCRETLIKGGALAIASTSKQSFDKVGQRYRKIAETLGFDLRVEDVTLRVVQAIEKEPSHISRRLSRFRWPLRRLAREIFISEGSERHRELKSGQRCYYFAVLTRPS